jgi:hypothetical protein
MNQKVEEFLTKAKAEETKQAEKEKRRILISAGLFEKETVYGDSYSAECPYYDNEKKKYYGTKKNPVDVTEEEYAEILKYTTAKKDKEDEEEIKATPVNDGAEKTLNTIANPIIKINFSSFECENAHKLIAIVEAILAQRANA